MAKNLKLDSSAAPKAFGAALESNLAKPSVEKQAPKKAPAKVVTKSADETSQFSEKKPAPAALKPISIHKGENNSVSEVDDSNVDDSREDQGSEKAKDASIAAWMAAHGLNLHVLKAFKAEQTQEKQTAITDFVSQMQKQFGLTPEQIVKAFQKMDPKDLQLPPDQTAQKFLSNLGLKAEQKPQAALLYKSMLQKTEAATLNEKVVDQVVTAQAVEKSPLVSSNVSELAKQLSKTSENEKIPAALLQSIEKLKSAQAAPPVIASPVIAFPVIAFPVIASQGAATAPKPEASTDDDSSKLGLAPILQVNATQASSLKAQTNEVGPNLARSGSTESLAAMMPSLAALASRFNQGGKESGNQKDGSSKKDLAASVDTAAQSTADNKGFATLTAQNQAAPGTTAAAVSAQGPQLSAQDRADNLNEIISKAQFVTKNGGGEMKVELKGEEMGPLNLKISVDKGQVSIQMVTQNEKTKKLIEDNLQELKTSLSAHKLHVDDLKVDLADGFQKQMDNQNPQQNREQGREAASQFLSNMHDDRESNRQGFFDASAFKAYRRDPSQRETLAPATVAQNLASAQSRARQMDSSRRLNLVA